SPEISEAEGSGETEISNTTLDATRPPRERDAGERGVGEDTSLAEPNPQNATDSGQHDGGTSATEDTERASTDAGSRGGRRGPGDARRVGRDAADEITCESACSAAGAECQDNVCVFTCAAGECADDIQCPDD